MDIFKVEILGKDSRIIVFGNNEDFTISDNNIISNQRIHYDDTIQTIKNKILIALDYNVCYEELYLFGLADKKLSKDKIFNNIIDSYDDFITLEKYKQFLSNVESNIDLEDKEKFYYKDVNDFENKVLFKSLVGNRFEKQYNYLFSVNPFDCVNIVEDSLIISDDSVLLDFLDNNTLYLCLAEDVLKETKVNKEQMIKMYYPQLYKNTILNESILLQKRIGLIENNKKNIPKELLSHYEIIDKFYDIYDKIKDEKFKYNKIGVKSFDIVIKTDYIDILPLDAIFKNIHATLDIPFIKYNPGIKRDTMYRLYSEKISETGIKVPYLPSSDILKYAKEVGKNDEIIMVVKHVINNNPLDVNIYFKKNGNLLINCIFDSLDEDIYEDCVKKIENVFFDCVNPIIDKINEYLESIGYKLKKFSSFNDDFISVDNINFISKLKITKKMELYKYKNLLSSLFFMNPKDLTKNDMKLFFKRVTNYKEMDEKDEFIADSRKSGEEISVTISGLVKYFNLSQEEAEKILTKFMSSYNFLNDELIENNGFPLLINLDRKDNMLTFDIEKINSIYYLFIINNYFKGIISLFEKSDKLREIVKSIDQLNKKEINHNKLEEVRIEKIIAPVQITTIQSDFLKLDEEKYMDEEDEEEESDQLTFGINIDDEEEEEEEEEQKDSSKKLAFNFDDEEEEEDEEEEHDDELVIKGGDDLNVDLTGLRLKNPNPFQQRIEDRDKELILKKKEGKFKQFSRTCPVSARRQPVILNNEEFEKIKNNHKDSYNEAIKYGSKKDKEHWYICPRYWDFKRNVSLSEEEVKRIPNWEKTLIPKDATTIEKGQYIYQFLDPKEHLDDNKNYIPHYPGLILDNHPKGYRIPCCFKNPNHGLKEKKEQNKSNYVVDANKFPLPEDRLGFLPNSIQSFFNTNNKMCVSKSNSALIKPNTKCFLRYGVEQSMLQSIIGCFADIYGYVRNVEKPTIYDMLNKIVKAITFDKYLEYQNASFVSIFKPKKINVKDISEYANTNFYKSIDLNDRNELAFLKETIASYENFLNYLKDPKTIMDHSYFWSIISEPNSKLLPQGINLSILELLKDENKLEMVCPTNPYQRSLFYDDRDTLVLLKQNEFYEPVYLYESRNKSSSFVKLFSMNSKNDSIKFLLNNIKNITNKYCKPKPSMPLKYKYLRPKYLYDLIDIFEKYKIKIEYEVMNYQTKIIGLYVSCKEGSVFVPCYPSSPEKYDIASIEDVSLWNTYKNTIRVFNSLEKITQNELNMFIDKKIVKDGNIIGLLTNTNQYIRISKPESAQKNMDNIEVSVNSDYIDADTDILFKDEDKDRLKTTKNILFESRYYTIFRSTIRILLSDLNNRSTKIQILNTISDYKEDNLKLYKIKLNKLYYLLSDLSKDYIVFDDVKDFDDIDDINTCVSKCNKNCKKKGDKCLLVIPKNNLNNNSILNEMLYFMKLADELLRFNRIRHFILEPNKYLNLTDLQYKVYDNEILLVDSFMKSEYFNELVIFNNSDFNTNITFELAKPNENNSQTYSNKLTI